LKCLQGAKVRNWTPNPKFNLKVTIHRSQIHLSLVVEEMKCRILLSTAQRQRDEYFGTKIKPEPIDAVPLFTMWMECVCRGVTCCDTKYPTYFGPSVNPTIQNHIENSLFELSFR
jgi:hypothetical protein